jgi:outer membrane protein assembly factor BamB
MLALGREQRDLVTIQRVIDAFPNARAARQGLLAKGELLERQGEYPGAVRSYLQVLHRDPKRPDAPDIVRRIVEAYLRCDRPSAAKRWLARGARLFPTYRFDHKAEPIGFAEYRRLIADARPATLPQPRFSLPLAKRWSRDFGGWVSVLRPDRSDLPTTRWDMYVTYSGGEVQAFTAPGNRAMWDVPVRCQGNPTLLGMTAERLVLVTRRRLMGVDIETGKIAWSVQAYSADADRPEIDPEDLRKWVGWTMIEDRVFAVSDDGQAICVDSERGRAIWRSRLADMTESKPVANDEFFVYEASAAHRQRFELHVLEAETGRPVRKIETSGLGRSVSMQLTEQGLLLVVTGRRLCAFDPYSGKQVWKTSASVPNFRATLLSGPLGLYLSHDARTLVRRSLETGEAAAQSPSLPQANRSGMVPTLDGHRLFVRTPQSVVALDARTLESLWRGTTDRNANVVVHQIGRPYVVCIDQRSLVPGDRAGRQFLAYFYDRRDDSGLIPAIGGVVDLGSYENSRGVNFADHTLLVIDGQTVHGWTGPGR